MILSFSDPETERLFRTGKVSRRCPWQHVLKVAKRKLDGLNAAEHIEDLLAPPGNRLELLKGDLAGRWSIRINDQFRIVFRWDKGSPNPFEVEIRDYH
jgi:proteic killer suppression protein